MNKIHSEKYTCLKLNVQKTSKNIYCQILRKKNKSILISSSSLDKQIMRTVTIFNIKNKILISKLTGFLLKKKYNNIYGNNLLFNKSRYKYHGRISALVSSAINDSIKF